jgi:UrcA family protein
MNAASSPNTRRFLRRFSLPALAVMVCALTATTIVSTPAHAADEDSHKMVVGYGDLNLANNKAVKVLYRRLSTAATSVCGRYDDRAVARKAIWQHCYEHALSAAVLEVNEPALSALHGRRHHGPVTR